MWICINYPDAEKRLAERLSKCRDPFDHDGDGKPGGSLPGEQSTVAKGRRKKKSG